MPETNNRANTLPDESGATKRELVVIAKRDAGLRAGPLGMSSTRNLDTSSLADLLQRSNARLEPLFGISEERLMRSMETLEPGADEETFNLPNFYSVQAGDEELEELAEALQEHELVDSAYIKPAIELPIAPEDSEDIPEISRTPHLPLASSINFANRQIYLNAAPEGIEARYAWTLPGGRGVNVNIIDLESGWNFTHTDLRQNQGGVVAGRPSTDINDENHGTAVLGEYSGDSNSFGIVGICPDARAGAVAWSSMPSARAIRIAADRLRPGDIMLLEGHRPGPRFNYQEREDQRGYIALEWWPDDYEAIRYAVNRGILVVAAAGNGDEDLDDFLFSQRPSAGSVVFPIWWRNPFNRDLIDSGSIIVGAGSPPAGTHGRTGWGSDTYVDRARLGFSNYGSCVDAQGWGREVTSCGYGDLWCDLEDPSNRERWFTDTFAGTSSASPIVVGALGCVQGVLRAQDRNPLSPALARRLLRTTGSPQQDAPGYPSTQRIGNRPNLRQLIQRALETDAWTGVQFRDILPARQIVCWFTYNWPTHWHVTWTVVPVATGQPSPQIKWHVSAERVSGQYVTYWICVENLTWSFIEVESRYTIQGSTS